jgi:hypothetical protein
MSKENYLWNAETTDFSMSVPPEGAWRDPSEWRLVSYIALAAGNRGLGHSEKQLLASIQECFGTLNVSVASCRSGRRDILLLYGGPYAPLLRFATLRKDSFRRHFGQRFHGAGQLLVSLPPSPIPHFFWKHDVLAFKEGERTAAKALCRKYGRKYGETTVPWRDPSQSLRLQEGPAWRWWTKYLNEDLPDTAGQP